MMFSTELRFHAAQALAIGSQAWADGYELNRYPFLVPDDATDERAYRVGWSNLVHAVRAHLNYNGCQVSYAELSEFLYDEVVPLVNLSIDGSTGYDTALRAVERWAHVQGYTGPVSPASFQVSLRKSYTDTASAEATCALRNWQRRNKAGV